MAGTANPIGRRTVELPPGPAGPPACPPARPPSVSSAGGRTDGPAGAGVTRWRRTRRWSGIIRSSGNGRASTSNCCSNLVPACSLPALNQANREPRQNKEIGSDGVDDEDFTLNLTSGDEPRRLLFGVDVGSLVKCAVLGQKLLGAVGRLGWVGGRSTFERPMKAADKVLRPSLLWLLEVNFSSTIWPFTYDIKEIVI